MQHRIVYTRHEGGVTVVLPSVNCFGFLQSGGRWDNPPRGFFDAQIESQTADGIAEDVASEFVNAMQFGGKSEAEAWRIIRDRDCLRFGKHHERVQADELPDRWFRDAWTRGHNGGPVSVNLVKAKKIQMDKIKASISKKNNPRIALGRKVTIPPWWDIGNAVRRARDTDELRKIWPEELTRHIFIGESDV